MANCKTRAGVKVNSAVAAGLDNIQILQNSILSGEEVVNALSSDQRGTLLVEDNYKEVIKDHRDTANALKHIKSFKDFGLVISKAGDALSAKASVFLDKVLKSKDEAIKFVNKITPDGLLSSSTTGLLYMNNGILTSNVSVESLNNTVNTLLGTRLNADKKYFAEKSGRIVVSSELQHDINEFHYAGYLQSIGGYSQINLDNDGTQEKEVNDLAKELNSGPLVAHINLKLQTLRNYTRKLKEDGKSSGKEATAAREEIASLETRKTEVKSKLTKIQLLEYFDSIIEDIGTNLSNGKILTPDSIEVYTRALKLVENASLYTTDNSVLSIDEINHKTFMDQIQERAKEARKLSGSLQSITIASVKNSTEATFSKAKIGEKDFFSVKNLNTWARRTFQTILGMDSIDNPVVQMIGQKVKEANIRAHFLAQELNRKMRSLHAKLGNFDDSTFLQKDNEGELTGFLVDIFSSDYWHYKTQSKLRNNRTDRLTKMVDFNPEILFTDKHSDAVKAEHIAELKDNLGEYGFDMYYKESEKLWNQYLSAREVFRADFNPSATEALAWDKENSPIWRIHNFKHNVTVAKTKYVLGTDRFMITVPKRVVNGKLSKYYDPSFDTINNDSNARELYQLIRQSYIDNEIALDRKVSIYKPPTIGYVGKSIGDMAGTGDYEGAVRMMYEQLSNDYVKDSVYSSDLPVDPITKKYKPKLKSDIHSIPDEIRRRLDMSLRSNIEYQAQDLSTEEGRARRAVIKAETRKEMSKQVSNERSPDLLSALVLANYSTSSYIEKAKIETELQLAQNLINSDIMKYPYGKKDAFEKSQQLVKDSVKYFMATQFYGLTLKEQQSFFSGEVTQAGLELATEGKTTKKTTGFSSRNAANIAADTARVLFLGWSFNTSLINIGQALFSNIVKGNEGVYFTVPNLMKAYGTMLSSRSRNIVDNLYVLGDIAYQGDKADAHKGSTVKGLLKPMGLQVEAEKINQGSVAIAVLMGITVTDTTTGAKVSLYDVISEEGTLDNKYKDESGNTGSEVLIDAATNKIRPANSQASGDYHSPLLAERSDMGKVLLIFKKYAPAMLYDRFGERRIIYAEGRAVEGRYIGAMKLAKHTLNKIRGVDSAIDEVSLKGASATLTDIVLMVTLKLLFVGIAKGTCDTPECKEQSGTTLYMLNQLSRLSSDVMFAVSPSQLKRMVVEPFAVDGVIQEFFDAADNFSDYFLGTEEDSGLYKSDTDFFDKGDPKFYRNMQNLVPFYRSNVLRTRRLTNKLYVGDMLGKYIAE